MRELDQVLANRLRGIEEAGFLRRLQPVDSPQGTRIRIAGQDLVNFSSNDYLGLANEAGVKEATVRAVRDWGAGSGSARLLSGSLGPHRLLEDRLARFKSTPAALTFSSGYATALGTVGALCGREDIILLDKLSHACLVDAALLSGAKLRVFDHNDPANLEAKLAWAAEHRAAPPGGNVLVITESVFSMDGDRCPLREIVKLKDRYGAWLLLDEAHATGLIGPGRRGLAEELDISTRVEVQMGTLGKALGSAGGYICGSRPLVEFVFNKARSFIFSTAPVPAAPAAAMAAIDIVDSAVGEARCRRLWANTRRLASMLGLPEPQSAIVPCMMGPEQVAVQAAQHLRQNGFHVPAVRYPTVPRGKARLRITLTADHTENDIDRLAEALKGCTPQVT